MKLTGNSRAVQIVIVLLLIATLWFAFTRKASAEEPTFFAGAGHVLASNRPIASGLRFGVEQGVWQASLVTHGETVIERDGVGYVIEPNIGACGTWNVARRRLSIGWGACLWEHGDFAIGDEGPVVWDSDTRTLRLEDDGPQLCAAIAIRRTLGKRERFFGEWFHCSTGGSTHYNRGRNWLGGGARF